MREMRITLRLTHQPFWWFRYQGYDAERPSHDHGQRPWRHLDTCGDVARIEAGVPRVDCPKHGGRQAHFSWAEPCRRFTSRLEARTIYWLKVATTNAVSDEMKTTSDQASGIRELEISPVQDRALQAGANDYGSNASAGDSERSPTEGDQRHRRIGQCDDSEDQSEGLRV